MATSEPHLAALGRASRSGVPRISAAQTEEHGCGLWDDYARLSNGAKIAGRGGFLHRIQPATFTNRRQREVSRTISRTASSKERGYDPTRRIRRAFPYVLVRTSACTSTERTRSFDQHSTRIGYIGRPLRQNSAAIGTARRPCGLSNTPTSLTAPKRFFTARTIGGNDAFAVGNTARL